MRHRSIAALFQYWTQLRGNRSAPKRSEVDPRSIASALGDVFLLDGDVETFAFRLAGSRIVEGLGRDLTGTSFYSIWADRALETGIRSLDLCAREGQPLLIGTKIHDPTPAHTSAQDAPVSSWANLRIPGQQPHSNRRRAFSHHGEMLLLPLEHHGEVGARVLGAFALFNPPTTRPDSPAELDITGMRTLGDLSRPTTPLGLVPASLADTVISRHGHLVLMRGMKEG